MRIHITLIAAMVLASACRRSSAAEPCRGLVGPVEERLANCLEEVRRLPLSPAAAELVRDVKGQVRSVGLHAEGAERVPVEELLERWMATDEAALAEHLRGEGVRAVAVPRPLTGALDRDQRVLARLAHHDQLDWFQLRHVAEHAFVYTVRRTSAKVPLEIGDALLRGLRARLEGQPREAWPPQTWNPASLRMMASLRLQGELLALRHASLDDDRDTIANDVLDLLADRLRDEWARRAETKGLGRLEDRLGDLRLEVHIVKERAPVEPRRGPEIAELWELGMDGMMFRQRPGKDLAEKFTYMPGSEVVTRSIKSPDAFLHFATDYHGWFDRRPWRDARTRLELIRDQHFMEGALGGGPAVRLVRGLPEVPQSSIDEEAARKMLIAGAEWWLTNQKPDGSFEYKYWPAQNRRSSEYNEVRHIMAARDLADAWRYEPDPRFLRGSRRAMDWLLQFEVDADDAPEGPLPHPPAGTTLFRYPSYELQGTVGKRANQKLGTVAVGMLGWIAWAEATGSHEEDERIRRMARFVRAMQQPDGGYRAYYVDPGHPYETGKNDIVPGEAMLALAEVAEYFDETDWIEGYDDFVAFYRPWFRERAARRRATGRWPHETYGPTDRLDIVQFGPWSIMAANKVHQLTGNPVAVDFGLEVADWLIDNYQWSGDRAPWPDYVGGYFKIVEELPAMQTFCYGEGTAAALALARRGAPERAEKFDRSTAEAIRFLDVMQFDDLDSYYLARPEQVRGGIKYTINENKIRIDYVGHGLSTLTQWLDARRGDPVVRRGAP